MAAELRALDAAGNYSEILPDWSDLTFSQDLLAAGALSFSYPTVGRHSNLLAHGVQLAILLDGVEPINGRFTYYEGAGSRIAEGDSGNSVYGCVSNLSRLNNVMLAPAFGSHFADEDLFAFVNKTPGFLLKNAIDNTMSRGTVRSSNPAHWLTHPITAFSDTLDSSGATWPTTYDVTWPSGTRASEVLGWLTDAGFAEAYMDGKVLKLFLPANNGTNLSLGANPTVLQTGRDFTSASYQTTSADLVNAVLVIGDVIPPATGPICEWVYDDASIATYGYREGTLQLTGATTDETLIEAGNVYLGLRKDPRWSYTYSVGAMYLDKSYGVPRPFIDYRVGDSILILDGVATSVQRLRLLSATWPNSTAASVNLTVNDWFGEREVELDKRIKRLSP